MKDFIGRREQDKEVTSKEWVVSEEVSFLWGNSRGPIRQIISLVLTR